MTHKIRVVAPFRPFPPEAPHHQELAAFDWMDAIEMLSRSVQLSCGVPVQILTDADTELPCATLQYATTQRRLMLWSLEVSACYLESDDFDRDTISLDCDQLVYQNLARWFSTGAGLGLLYRTHPPKGDAASFPILNGVQWWALRAKSALAAFYRRALEVAETLPEEQIVWGADTTALVRLLEPLEVGIIYRAGLTVHLIDSSEVIRALSTVDIRHLESGRWFMPLPAVLDFRNLRKPYMRPVFDATIGAAMTS